MPSYKTSQRLTLVERVLFTGVLAIVTYIRYARQQKECRLSSLSQKYSECIRTRKKYEPAEPVVNFNSIDRAIEKLKREEVKTEAAQEAANETARVINEVARVKQSKLKRLRAQKRFLKEKE